MAKFHGDDYIEERKDVMLGKPVFKGTRLTVELVLKALGGGDNSGRVAGRVPPPQAGTHPRCDALCRRRSDDGCVVMLEK
jgi:hypothetical protein